MDCIKLSLKGIRELRGLTQEEAAKAIGISKETLGNYERGRTFPDVPVIRKIEEVYKVSYNQIIFLPTDYDLIVNLNENKSKKGGE